jgi:hypothetical protein
MGMEGNNIRSTRRSIMLLILPALMLVLIAVVLDQRSKTKLSRDYMELVVKGAQDGEGVSQQHLAFFEEYLGRSSLRRGLFATIFGFALFIVPFIGGFVLRWGYAFASVPPGPVEPRLLALTSVGSLMDLLWVGGVIVFWYGIANLVIWFLVDKPRLRRLHAGE